jgi:hypothetical protein
MKIMETHAFLLSMGFVIGFGLMALISVVLSNLPKKPAVTLLNYEDGRTTHIVSYEYPSPEKYIVVTTNGSYRVPENFMIYHAPGEKFLYIEDIETGNRQYPYPVKCYENEIKDLSHE